MPPQLLTYRQVGKRLNGVVVKTVQRLIREGKLACIEIGYRTRRVSPGAGDDFISKRERGLA